MHNTILSLCRKRRQRTERTRLWECCCAKVLYSCAEGFFCRASWFRAAEIFCPVCVEHFSKKVILRKSLSLLSGDCHLMLCWLSVLKFNFWKSATVFYTLEQPDTDIFPSCRIQSGKKPQANAFMRKREEDAAFFWKRKTVLRSMRKSFTSCQREGRIIPCRTINPILKKIRKTDDESIQNEQSNRMKQRIILTILPPGDTCFTASIFNRRHPKG